jgi:hypothetical protein
VTQPVDWVVSDLEKITVNVTISSVRNVLILLPMLIVYLVVS